LTATNSDGHRRLTAQHDYVRTEIESALSAGVEIIPVLADGATMPTRKDLPESIGDLSVRNAFTLPWTTGIARLTARIKQIERQRESREAAERAERARLDLAGGAAVSPGSWRSQSAVASFNVVVRAMELSLARQGTKIWLSVADLARSYGSLTELPLDLGFQLKELLHVIDFVGVKARTSNARYVARSYPLRGLADVPVQLGLGRPIIVPLLVQQSWFEAPILKTGYIDVRTDDHPGGSVLGAILGWDPATQVVKVLSPWPTWGNRGAGVLTRAATEKYLDSADMHAIEPVLKPPVPSGGRQRG
jgi:hypothetical protein